MQLSFLAKRICLTQRPCVEMSEGLMCMATTDEAHIMMIEDDLDDIKKIDDSCV